MTAPELLFLPDAREELERLLVTVGLAITSINQRRPLADPIENEILTALRDITERIRQVIQDIIDHPWEIN